MTSLHDTRVYYVEPAKWVAALRHTKTDGNLVLLKTQMTAGHGGISGRYERWKEAAYQYAWLLAAADRDHYGSGQVDDLREVDREQEHVRKVDLPHPLQDPRGRD